MGRFPSTAQCLGWSLLFLVGCCCWEREPKRDPAIINAAVQGNREAVERLIRGGANVGVRDQNGLTPLMHAAIYGYDDVVAVLLEAGAAVDVTCRKGCTALTYASHAGSVEAVRHLVTHGADLEHRSCVGDTPLYACACGSCHRSEDGVDWSDPDEPCTHHRVAAELINRGADANAASADGSTPLTVAVSHRRADLVQLLLQSGAAPEAVDRQGNTALSIARKMNYGEILLLLTDVPGK